MRSIGIRVEPKEVHYTIFDNEEKENGEISYYSGSLVVPVSMKDDIPRLLSYIRTNIFSIICENEVIYAGIRTIENISDNTNIFRANIEGVIQELFSNSTIIEYYAGGLGTIASMLKTNVSDVKLCAKGKIDLFELDWSVTGKKINQRESLLTCLAARTLAEGAEKID
ncbi:hypothetical protein DHX103_11025 [Planococcus sp. X10-3]|uniref:hypothetical protein n=1 Tax=Planococcus sp. X10-3 TaxID=3061240 RepID=UPI003BAFDA7C